MLKVKAIGSSDGDECRRSAGFFGDKKRIFGAALQGRAQREGLMRAQPEASTCQAPEAKIVFLRRGRGSSARSVNDCKRRSPKMHDDILRIESFWFADLDTRVGTKLRVLHPPMITGE